MGVGAHDDPRIGRAGAIAAELLKGQAHRVGRRRAAGAHAQRGAAQPQGNRQLSGQVAVGGVGDGPERWATALVACVGLIEREVDPARAGPQDQADVSGCFEVEGIPGGEARHGRGLLGGAQCHGDQPGHARHVRLGHNGYGVKAHALGPDGGLDPLVVKVEEAHA